MVRRRDRRKPRTPPPPRRLNGKPATKRTPLEQPRSSRACSVSTIAVLEGLSRLPVAEVVECAGGAGCRSIDRPGHHELPLRGRVLADYVPVDYRRPFACRKPCKWHNFHRRAAALPNGAPIRLRLGGRGSAAANTTLAKSALGRHSGIESAAAARSSATRRRHLPAENESEFGSVA